MAGFTLTSIKFGFKLSCKSISHPKSSNYPCILGSFFSEPVLLNFT